MKEETSDNTAATKKRKANVKKEPGLEEEENEDPPVAKKRRANAKKEPRVKDEEVDDLPIPTKPKPAARKAKKVKVEEDDAAEDGDTLVRRDEEGTDIILKVKEEEDEHNASGSAQTSKKKAKTPRQNGAAKDGKEGIAQAKKPKATKPAAKGVVSPEGKRNDDIDRGASISKRNAGKTRKAAISEKTKRDLSQSEPQDTMSESAAPHDDQSTEQGFDAEANEEDGPVLAKAKSGRASRASKVRSKKS